jgi:hypothetical protein
MAVWNTSASTFASSMRIDLIVVLFDLDGDRFEKNTTISVINLNNIAVVL